MKENLTIAIGQINPVLGAISDNAKRIARARKDAAAQGADLIVFPELCLSAYPTQDLVRLEAFLTTCREQAQRLALETNDGGPAMIIGIPWVDGSRIYNAVLLLDGGEIMALRKKVELPNYGVFDEKRNFTPGPLGDVVLWRGVKLGLMICEDMWFEKTAAHLHDQGAEIFIVPHGSPFRHTAERERFAQGKGRVAETRKPLLFVNQIGGQDELVFDGGAFALSPQGEIEMRAPRFEEGVFITKWQRQNDGWHCVAGPMAEALNQEEKVYRACVLGLRDYVRKNGFSSVVLGLSGGVDSALVASMAVDALGADNVHCVMLPSPHTSDESKKDASDCAEKLGVDCRVIDITPSMLTMEQALGEAFTGHEQDLTEENLQSRLRGVVLMALSNKFGHLLLSTGNKSELAVGYATLYGDMNGAFNPLKDIYKTLAYDLCRWRNQLSDPAAMRLKGPAGLVIPDNIITKAPTAELRPDQLDADSLPPYEVLDAILHGLVEEEASVGDIVARGFDRALVERIQHLLFVAEYKRYQAPPGPKITTRNFGRDRRFPMTNHWRG